MNARLVPRRLRTAATVTVSTTASESGGLIRWVPTNRRHLRTLYQHVWDRFASQAGVTPTWYTLVVATKPPAGHIMLGTKTDGVQLRHDGNRRPLPEPGSWRCLVGG